MGTFHTKTSSNKSSWDVYSDLGLLDEPDDDGGGGEEESGTINFPPVLSLLASILQKTIKKNERSLRYSARKKEKPTPFHGSRAPTMSIRHYIERAFRYSKCSSSCFVISLIYIERFVQSTGSCLTSLNIHRLFITSVLLAAKFLDDTSFNNAYYAKVGGVSAAEMNKLEMKFLFVIDFRLHVTLDTFDQYCLLLQEEAAGYGNSKIEWALQVCGAKGSWLNLKERR